MRIRVFSVVALFLAACGSLLSIDGERPLPPADADASEPDAGAGTADAAAPPDATDARPDAPAPVQGICSTTGNPKCACDTSPCTVQCEGSGDCYVSCPSNDVPCVVTCDQRHVVVCERGVCFTESCDCTPYTGKCRP